MPVPSILDLNDRVTIVTGAGRGIGREVARVLAQAGAMVVVAEIDTTTGPDTVREIGDAGGRAAFVRTDVQDRQSVKALTDEAIERFRHIDILVNNAGIVVNTPSEDVPPEEWTRILGVNLDGVFWCCQAVGRHMLMRRQGAIVNIASISGTIVNKPQPQVAYNASKAGVIMLTKSLAAEWADRGVRVNAVSPGYIATKLTERGLNNPAWRKLWEEMTPMGRIATPSEVAYAVWYLASDAASFATGTNLVVDGGYTAW